MDFESKNNNEVSLNFNVQEQSNHGQVMRGTTRGCSLH
jgi:hypothetical protein